MNRRKFLAMAGTTTAYSLIVRAGDLYAVQRPPGIIKG
jgi:hypothetical protein